MRRRVVVTDQAFGGVTAEAAVAAQFGATFSSHQCTSEEQTIQAVNGSDVVLVNFAPITAAVLRTLAPGATVVRYGIGYDNIDVEAARELGIAVANVPDYGSDTVADHAAACLLMLLRKIPQYDRAVRVNGWCQPASLGSMPGFSSTTVALIGTGRIGRALNRRLQGFGFTVLAHDPYADAAVLKDEGLQLVGLDELLRRANAVSLHLPLTPENAHLVNAEFLSLMRRGSFLVNTSRGGLVDESALASAIEQGHLAGACLDVFDPEPLATDSKLRALSDVFLTPHAAFFSDDSLEALQRLAAEEAGRALAGSPLRSPVV